MKTQDKLFRWMTDTLQEFVDQLSLSRSRVTVEAYRKDIENFLCYLVDEGVKKLGLVKPLHLVRYLGHCKTMGKSDASVARYYMAIRGYGKYLRKSGAISVDFTEDVKAPRALQKAPCIPTLEEMAHLLAMPDTTTDAGMRDRAILALLYSSALRASELCDLTIDDLRGNSVTVRCGKRGKTRTIPITEEAVQAIEEYVDQIRGRDKGSLFLTSLSKPIRRQLLFRIISSYAHKAGLDHVTPHTLRHACATHLLDHGADLRLIQEVLGHSSIASTQRYTHLSSMKLQEKFHAFHPRSR